MRMSVRENSQMLGATMAAAARWAAFEDLTVHAKDCGLDR